MSKYKFDKGARVVLARPDEDDIEQGLKEGMTGTVVDNSRIPFVVFDYFQNTEIEGSTLAIHQDQLDPLPSDTDKAKLIAKIQKLTKKLNKLIEKLCTT